MLNVLLHPQTLLGSRVISCWLWLVGWGASLLPTAAPAQLVEFDFPATHLLSASATEDDSPTEGSTSLVAGGHTLASCTWTLAGRVEEGLPVTQVASRRLWVGAEERLRGGLTLSASSLVLFGSYEHESGWIGRFDIGTGQFEWKSLLASPITAACAFPQRLIVGDETGQLRSLQLASGEETWNATHHANQVTAVCGLAPRLATSGDWSGGIKLFDPVDGRELYHFAQHRDRITGLVALSPASPNAAPQLVSSSRDGTVRLWYPNQRRMVRFVQLDSPVVQLVGLSTGQRVMVATEDAQLHIVDLATAKVVNSFASGLAYVAQLNPLAAPDRWIAFDGLGKAKAFTLLAEESLPAGGKP